MIVYPYEMHENQIECLTTCMHLSDNTMVGSVACDECPHIIMRDTLRQKVLCGYLDKISWMMKDYSVSDTN